MAEPQTRGNGVGSAVNSCLWINIRYYISCLLWARERERKERERDRKREYARNRGTQRVRICNRLRARACCVTISSLTRSDDFSAIPLPTCRSRGNSSRNFHDLVTLHRAAGHVSENHIRILTSVVFSVMEPTVYTRRSYVTEKTVSIVVALRMAQKIGRSWVMRFEQNSYAMIQ